MFNTSRGLIEVVCIVSEQLLKLEAVLYGSQVGLLTSNLTLSLSIFREVSSSYYRLRFRTGRLPDPRSSKTI